jgi:uncharacterized delta-60 repeat protein
MKPSLSLLVAFFATLTSFAQRLDVSFQSPLPLRSAYICDIIALPDGKMLIGGEISYFEAQQVPNLIRLNGDGSLDESFSFDYDAGWLVMGIENYGTDQFAVLLRKYSALFLFDADAVIVIIDSNGTPVNEVPTLPYADEISVHSSGRILVSAMSVAMYHSDLTLDEAFTLKASPAGVAKFSGDQVVIAGNFTEIDGTPINDIARLNFDGSLDESFNPGTGTDDYIGAFMVQPDGKIILGKTYINSFNGQPCGGTIRLNTDGSIDQSFAPPRLNGGLSLPVYTDEGIYAAAYLQIGDEAKDRIFRMNSVTGALDNTFPPVEIDEFGSWDCQLAISGSDLISNSTQAHGNVFGLSKITASGNYVESFKPEVARLGTVTFGDIFNDKILIAGDFIRINGVESFGAARINLDGSVDESFRLKENKGIIRQVELLDEENILISTYKNFFKLDTLGDERPEFSWSHFDNLWQIIKFEMLPDGKIMVADPNTIHRLHPDGSKDASFDKGELCCIASTAFDFDMQDEKTIYGSAFSSLGGTAVTRLARLHPDGTVDQTFDIGTGPNDMITTVKVLDNREIIVGGFFDSFDGHSVPHHLVKLSPDGALNLEFNVNQAITSIDGSTYAMQRIEQYDSTLYFRTFYGVFALKLDGKIDSTFSMPVEVTSLNDIIVLKNQNTGGRSKSELGLMFALGNFSTGNASAAQVMIKLDLTNTTPTDTVPDPTVTGTEADARNNELGVEVFPQPVKETLTIDASTGDGMYVATIYDLSGKTYFENNLKVENHRAEIDVSHTPPGFYVLRVSGRGKTSLVKYIRSR